MVATVSAGAAVAVEALDPQPVDTIARQVTTLSTAKRSRIDRITFSFGFMNGPFRLGEVFSVALHSFVLQQSWCSQFRSRPTVQARHLPAADRPRRRRRYRDQPRCGRARR